MMVLNDIKAMSLTRKLIFKGVAETKITKSSD